MKNGHFRFLVIQLWANQVLLGRGAPPPLYLWTCLRNFFINLISRRQKVLKKFGFRSASPPHSLEMSKVKLKSFSTVLELAPFPPSLENVKTKAEKRSSASFSKALDSVCTPPLPPPPPLENVQS